MNALLNRDEAEARAYGGGNVCKVGMVAIDPHSEREDYAAAVPLFVALLGLFYSLRMRAVVAQTATPLAGRVLEHAGAELVRRRGTESVWYFDQRAAHERIPSGLSVVYFSMWALPAATGRLGLSRRERELVWRAIREGASNENLARSMHISRDAVASHWKNVFEKARRAHVPGCRVRGSRGAVIAFCQAHPEELRLVPEG